ncbi:three component ABC system middle component [Herbaspirillum lusitanum]|uniref:three component ABC system middle component n=1 Tax=Herbaspirillum lusitanum TaxID=213312 RepID=UPI000A01FF46|nr:three component ABC system middle component [Herbaspirillum lusitanum]
MSALSREVRYVQNPAMGAALVWRFICGYTENHKTSNAVPLPLIFIVLPILFHEATAQFVKSTLKSSGLRAFATKFGESKTSKQDVLLGIHERTLRLRGLTRDAMRLGLVTRLFYLGGDAGLFPLSRTQAIAGMSDEIRQLMRDAEKLGVWCAQLTLHEISATLKVRF